MSFEVLNYHKRKGQSLSGIESENNRTSDMKHDERYKGHNIDWSRTDENVFLVKNENWNAAIKEELSKRGIKSKSNSVLTIDQVYTASPEFFEGKSKKEIETFFKDCLEFSEKRFGVTLNAVIHYDQTTPHMHVNTIPITQDGRLSAKEIVGNMKRMSETQDLFYSEVGKKWNLERGEKQKSNQTKKRHIDAIDHVVETKKTELHNVRFDIEKETEKRDKLYAETSELTDIKAETQKEISELADMKKCFENDIKEVTEPFYNNALEQIRGVEYNKLYEQAFNDIYNAIYEFLDLHNLVPEFEEYFDIDLQHTGR